MQTITGTTFRNFLADPVGTRRGPPLVRGPQFENRWLTEHGCLTTGVFTGQTVGVIFSHVNLNSAVKES